MRAPSRVEQRSYGRRRGAGTTVGRSTEVPVPPRALQLLARADGELVAAQMSGQDWERFWHAHLAGVRAGAAVLAVRGAPTGRGAPRDVWGMLDLVAPELAGWSAYLAQGAGLRAAVEAGRLELVTAVRADEALSVAQGLVEAIRVALGRSAPVPVVRAS